MATFLRCNVHVFDNVVKMQAFKFLSDSASSNSIVLALATVMGMYFVSSVILLRTNMPEQYRRTITAVLGPIHFDFYHRW